MKIIIVFLLQLILINLSYCDDKQDTNYVIYKSSGNFNNAVSVTDDGKGFIYILDTDNSEIVKYSAELKEIKRAGKKGWKNGDFFSPAHIDASNGTNIFVSDKLNSRIQTFDLNLGFISSLLTDSEIIEDKFKIRKPVCAVPVNSIDLFVLDGDNPKVVLFSGSLTPVSYFGSYQSVSGALSNPVKIVRDSKNNVYIFDRQKNSVLRYDNFGTFISELTSDDIISIAIYSDLLYVMSKSGIISYDVNKNSYQEKIALPRSIKIKNLTDLAVTGYNKLYLLEKDKIHLLIKN
ncbi:MAG: NHL repeat-containing protein [Ignavibacteria bacterium]|nr:NHL repeat-containing protein [Ignavibacteria bacterium]